MGTAAAAGGTAGGGSIGDCVTGMIHLKTPILENYDIYFFFADTFSITAPGQVGSPQICG